MAAGLPVINAEAGRIASEQRSQRLVIAFVLSGMLFMLLPGTFLGVWNLLSISQAHQPFSLSQAWLQAHGQAQIFGWVGSFILGIGFYSLTKMRSTRSFPARAGWTAWTLWTCGVLLRWFAGVTGDIWRVLLPVSAILQLAGVAVFFVSVRRHRHDVTAGQKRQMWMQLVVASTAGFLVTQLVNAYLMFRQALEGSSPALSHVPDQQFVTLAVWGILVPAIWGFNARWIPVFAGLRQPRDRVLWSAYLCSVAGILATFLNFLMAATIAFLAAAVLAILGLQVWGREVNPPKLLNVHRSFAWFLRLTYVWLLISCVLAVMALRLDHTGGFWGASRHALTVGFVAGMVFTIGQRVLPAFCGMRVLWSKQLMFWSLFLLFTGCLLRVSSEPLAYEGIWTPAWKILPISAVTELIAVSLFAWNIAATLLQPPAHLQSKGKPQITIPASRPGA